MTAAPPLAAADLLAAGLGLPLPARYPVEPVPPGTRCALTGVPLAAGVPVTACITAAHKDLATWFRGRLDGWVSASCAACFGACGPGGAAQRSTLAIADATGQVTAWQPLIARDSATAERPCWSDLVRAIWPARAGHAVAVLVTADTKPILWPRVAAGALGAATPVYVHDPEQGLARVLRLDWLRLLALLERVEAVYQAGFVKRAIRSGLLSCHAATAAVGLPTALAWERELAPERRRPEFAVAVLLAQKESTP